mmetsp:Transcript_7183/g.10938  ORF Transcript_7183/g.10938 Transcript_7183/m.10938 type:complete len:87 (-) Transcript_7183:80-340(-)
MLIYWTFLMIYMCVYKGGAIHVNPMLVVPNEAADAKEIIRTPEIKKKEVEISPVPALTSKQLAELDEPGATTDSSARAYDEDEEDR